MATTTLRPPKSSTRSLPRPGLLLTVVLGGLFMNLLDISIVNVAIGQLAGRLHAGGAQLQLIVSGYVMAYAALLILGARLGGRFGHRRIFRIGLAAFVITSAACGAAPAAGALVLFRLLQGAAAALMLPQVMSLIQLCFAPGKERTRALGWYGLVLAVGSVAGQVLGGALLSADPFGLGWRVVFLVNVPVGVTLYWCARVALPADTRQPVTGFDIPGVAIFGALIGLVVIPLVLGRELHWPFWGFVCWGIALALLPAFVATERRAAAPVMPAELLRAPGLMAGACTLLVGVGGYAGMLFTMSVHLQTAVRLGPMATGLTFLPLAIGFAATSLASPRMPQAATRRLIPVGIVCTGIALALLAAHERLGQRPDAELVVVLLVLGAAMGMATTPVMGLALTRVPLVRAGEASGVLSTTFQLAQVIGVAGVGSLYLDRAAVHGSSSAIGLSLTVLATAMSLALVASLLLLRSTRTRA